MDYYEETIKITGLLCDAGYPTMLAGGCVRDRLLGMTPKDYDLATAAQPEQGMALFREWGYKTVATGLAHGTFSLVTPRQTIEITTLRQDLSCDGRRAEVHYTENFAKDAERRDFTINALYEDRKGSIHDYVGGLEDLKKKRLRFVGDAGTRIAEDYLRILRYFRFLARLGWRAEEKALEAIRPRLEGLKNLSVERIQCELTLILTAEHGPEILGLMGKQGVLPTLFPGFDSERGVRLEKLLAALAPVAEPLLAWHALLFWCLAGTDRPVDWNEERQRWRFSRAQARLLGQLFSLFQTSGTALERLSKLLKLLERDALDLTALGAYLAINEEMGVLDLPSSWRDLLKGFGDRRPPPIPEGALRANPPVKRAGLVSLAKISWYLGICRDTKQIQRVLEEPETFLVKLDPEMDRPGKRDRERGGG